jgi:hypothetical protein
VDVPGGVEQLLDLTLVDLLEELGRLLLVITGATQDAAISARGNVSELNNSFSFSDGCAASRSSTPCRRCTAA